MDGSSVASRTTIGMHSYPSLFFLGGNEHCSTVVEVFVLWIYCSQADKILHQLISSTSRIPLVVQGGRDERKVILGRDSKFHNIDDAERKWKSIELTLAHFSSTVVFTSPWCTHTPSLDQKFQGNLASSDIQISPK